MEAAKPENGEHPAGRVADMISRVPDSSGKGELVDREELDMRQSPVF